MWDESKHPRDDDGKFTDGSGETGTKEKTFTSGRFAKVAADEDLTHGKGKKKQFFNRQKPLEHHTPLPPRPDHIDGVKRREEGMTHEEADSGKVNPKYADNDAYKRNCQICVATYIAKRRGYDVEALPFIENNKAMEEYASDPLRFYKESKEKPIVFEKKEKGISDFDYLKKRCYNGSIVALNFNWKSRPEKHIIVAENIDGKIRLYDPQNNKAIESESGIKKYLSKTNDLHIADLTKADIDERVANKTMRRRER